MKIFRNCVIIVINISFCSGCQSENSTYDISVSKDSVISQVNTIRDIDGNVYHTIKIGNQVWMKENLKVTHYRNGDAIRNILNAETWQKDTSGAYCNYDDDTSLVRVFGRLYNWYVAKDYRSVCPAGWHIPTNTEWNTLITAIGGANLAGGEMKERGHQHWADPNAGATNSTGFSALPGGGRSRDGTFYNLGTSAYFWNADEYYNQAHCNFEEGCANECTLNTDGSYLIQSWTTKKRGMSIRCIKGN